MAEPAVKNAPDEGDDSPDIEEDTEDAPEGGEQVVEDDDVEMVQTDIETTGTDPDGFFDGVETDSGSGDDVADSLFDGLDDGDGGSDDEEPKEAAKTRSSGLAADINRGVARAAVIGLDDKWETADGEERKKNDLKKEFEETFEAFRLGHYGSRVAEEYLLMEAEDIHPVWGLLGAALICAAVIVYRRPDGDQMVESAKMKMGQTDLSKIKNAVKKD
mgnify:CR=1 FL=1